MYSDLESFGETRYKTVVMPDSNKAKMSKTVIHKLISEGEYYDSGFDYHLLLKSKEEWEWEQIK